MKIKQPQISASKIQFWFLIVNLPLIAITFYVHYLLENAGQFESFFDSIGLWLLVAFKIIGANLILLTIFSEFKIKQS